MINLFIIVPNSWRKARAFTLLELFLVLAVIIAIAALIWPELTTTTKIAQLKHSARQSAMLLKLARNGAMAEACKYRCVFKYNGKQMIIEYQVDPLNQPDHFERLKAHWSKLNLGEYNIRCLNVELDEWEKLLKAQEKEITEQDDEIQQKYPPIVFYPDGRADSATIVLSDDKGNIVSLSLDGLTGEIKIVEGNILETDESEDR